MVKQNYKKLYNLFLGEITLWLRLVLILFFQINLLALSCPINRFALLWVFAIF